MKKQNKDWEKEFDERFAGKIDWLPVSGIIPEGISPRFVRHAQGELIEVIKDFIRRLLAQKEKEVIEEIEEDLVDCPSPKVPCLCDCHEEGKWCLKCLTGWHRPNLEMYFRNKLKGAK